MRIKAFVLSAIVVLIVALSWNLAAAAADQQSGTWKMNPEKSKYSPGPAAKSVNLTIEADENHIKINAEGVDGNGEAHARAVRCQVRRQGLSSNGLPAGDSVSVKRINADTIQATMKKGGTVMMTVTSVVSKDGKTRTSTFKVRMRKGRTYTTSSSTTSNSARLAGLLTLN